MVPIPGYPDQFWYERLMFASQKINPGGLPAKLNRKSAIYEGDIRGTCEIAFEQGAFGQCVLNPAWDICIFMDLNGNRSFHWPKPVVNHYNENVALMFA